MEPKAYDTGSLRVEVISADGSVKKNYDFDVSTFYNAGGKFWKKVGRIGKAVVSGGLSEKKVRKVVAAVTTAGLSQTKKGKQVSAKVEKGIAKAEAKAVQKFKTVSLALPRSAFSSLAVINIFGVASQLQAVRDAGEKGNKASADKWKKVRDFWYKMGGSRTKFDKMIKNGSKRKPFLAKVKKKTAPSGSKLNANGYDYTEFYFVGDEAYLSVVGVDDAAIAAWIGIASGVIAVIKKIAGKPPQMDAETEAAIDSDAAENQADFNTALAEEAENPTPEALRDLGMVMPVWGWVAVLAGIAGVAYLTIRAIKKR